MALYFLIKKMFQIRPDFRFTFRRQFNQGLGGLIRQNNHLIVLHFNSTAGNG